MVSKLCQVHGWRHLLGLSDTHRDLEESERGACGLDSKVQADSNGSVGGVWPGEHLAWLSLMDFSHPPTTQSSRFGGSFMYSETSRMSAPVTFSRLSAFIHARAAFVPSM